MKRRLSFAILICLMGVMLLTGCGGEAEDDNGYEADNDQQSEEYTEEYYDDEEYDSDEGSYFGERKGDEADTQADGDRYRTENVIPEYDDSGVNPIPTDINVYCDYAALEHAKETGTEDYLNWLCDTVINKYAPQAVDRLLAIPEFKEGAEAGLLSRYTTFNLTYNPETGYGAITLVMPVLEDGSTPTDDMETATIYNIGHQLSVNTSEFGPETMNDAEKQTELQATLLHEMMHAFMYDYARNSHEGCDRNGDFIPGESVPNWFAEGLAESVNSGFSNRYEEMISMAAYDAGDYDDIVEVFKDRERLWTAVQNYDPYGDMELDEEEKERAYAGLEGHNPMEVSMDYNTYSLGYVACMYLYSMAAQSLGKQAFVNGEPDMEALREGMGLIIQSLSNGYSLDEIIAEISTDEASGAPFYKNTADFEKKCFCSIDDPGFIFWQDLMNAYLPRVNDTSEYVPSGCVLDGYVNGVTPVFDDKYHAQNTVFMIPEPSNQKGPDYYAVSSVLPSDVTLGGTCHLSYAGEELTKEELERRNVQYVGDQLVILDAYE